MSSIAVVIPCYNQADYAREAVASVLAQRRAAAEIVIVDDGSDAVGAGAALEHAAAAGVRIIRTVRSGLAAARNTGINATKSNYVVTLDADDILDPEYLEETARVLDTDASLSFVTTGLRAFGDAEYEWIPPPCGLRNLIAIGGPHPASLMRRRFIEDIGGFDQTANLHGCEDLDLWVRAFATGHRGTVIPRPLLHYRVRSNSMHHRNVRDGTHAAAVQAVLTKNRDAIAALGPSVLLDKQHFLEHLVSHRHHLLQARGARSLGAVLLYHRIATREYDPWGLCTPAEEFEEQLKYLRRHCCVMSVDDLCESLAMNSTPERAVALTFDDGYADNLTTAAPMLERHGIPATFFVTSYPAQHFWWDDVASWFERSVHAEQWFHGAPLTGKQPANERLFAIRDHLLRMPAAERNLALTALRAQLPHQSSTTLPDAARLTDAEIRELASRPGASIGAHTANHVWLPAVPPREQEIELESNRVHLERVTNRAVRHAAYPFGAVDRTTARSAARVGMTLAFTTENRPLIATDHPLLLPRIDVNTLRNFERQLDDCWNQG